MGNPVNLTKTRSVLHLESAYKDAYVNFDRGQLDTGEHDDGRHARISFEDWVEMGAPTKITLTIEPGDLLNE
jgi:hypothetical protein